jgi:hypothetical protein
MINETPNRAMTTAAAKGSAQAVGLILDPVEGILSLGPTGTGSAGESESIIRVREAGGG